MITCLFDRRHWTRIRSWQLVRVGGVALACLFASTASCGEEAGPAASTDASTDAASCGPQVAPWDSTWTPPRPFGPGACTSDQIAGEAKCNPSFASFDPTACTTFERSPANATCRQCLLSTSGDPTLGAIVVHPDGRWFINAAGCIALIDGDSSREGCGARYEANLACRQAACDNCFSVSAYNDCWREAGNSACKSVADKAICAQSPVFGPCLDYDTYEELYDALTALFCSTGFTVPADAGFASDAWVEATTSE